MEETELPFCINRCFVLNLAIVNLVMNKMYAGCIQLSNTRGGIDVLFLAILYSYSYAYAYFSITCK